MPTTDCPRPAWTNQNRTGTQQEEFFSQFKAALAENKNEIFNISHTACSFVGKGGKRISVYHLLFIVVIVIEQNLQTK